MAAWRMAFRSGADVHRECDQCPHERWPQCRDLGVAAITYDPIQDIDFSPYSSEKQFPPKVKAAWSQLAPSQKASLRRFLSEMQEEDIIYVKQKELIVGKGVIGPYKFAKE